VLNKIACRRRSSPDSEEDRSDHRFDTSNSIACSPRPAWGWQPSCRRWWSVCRIAPDRLSEPLSALDLRLLLRRLPRGVIVYFRVISAGFARKDKVLLMAAKPATNSTRWG